MKNVLLWVIALIITLLTAYYQKKTGPTYPIEDLITVGNNQSNYILYRSHGGYTDHTVSFSVPDTNISAYLNWKRFKTDDQFTKVRMNRTDDSLTALLPHQPPAGKLEYYIDFEYYNNVTKLPADENVIIRFKGDVPLGILIPHIIFMFAAMLVSTRTGLEIFRKDHQVKKYTYWTLALLILGGFIFGPLTQLYAFDALWTGFPFGTDLTDNKTLIALIGWLIAIFMYSKSKKPTLWALFASLVLIIIFLIPHSLMGSELDYNKLEKNKVEVFSDEE